MKRAWEGPARERFAVERLFDCAAPEDIGVLEELTRESFEGSSFSIQEELARPWSRVWLARPADEAGAAPIGFLVAWHVADELHVLNIATRAPMRRRGVARALMDESLRYAREQHIRVLLLEVRRSNRAAIKLYRGLDFTALGVRSGYYSDNGEDAIEMILALDPATGRHVPSIDEIYIDESTAGD
jgi:ribosomal-protein-alanine N-acetyltransferase